MLTPERTLSSMRTDGHQTEQRVEVIPGQRPGMRAHAQLELGKDRVRGERHGQRHGGQQDRQRRAGRIDPDDADRRGDQLAGDTQEASRERRQLPHDVQAVHAFGDVGGEAAVEVAIRDARRIDTPHALRWTCEAGHRGHRRRSDRRGVRGGTRAARRAGNGPRAGSRRARLLVSATPGG